MKQDEYDDWQGRIAVHQAARRKRGGKINRHAFVRELWDSVSPPIKFDDLIPSWQALVTRFVGACSVHRSTEEAWKAVSAFSRWETLGPLWQHTLERARRGKDRLEHR